MPQKRKLKCSLCRAPGHTKRSCKKDMKVAAEKNAKEGESVLEKKTSKKLPVAILLSENVQQSPHVVDLRMGKKEEDVLQKVAVYKEQKPEPVLPVAMDVGQMVREANKERKLKWQVNKLNLFLRKKQKEEALQQRLLEKQNREMKFVAFKQNVKEKTDLSFSFDLDLSGLRQFFSSRFNFKKFAYQMIVAIFIFSASFPTFGYYQKLKAMEEVVVEQGTDGFMSLQASTLAAFQSNLDEAQTELFNALQSFSVANTIVEGDFQLLLSLTKLLPVVGTQISSRQNLLAAGSHLALGNTYLIKGIREAQNNTELPMTDRFDILQNHLRSALPQYKEALNSLNNVDLKTIPVKYQNTFSEFKFLFGTFIDDMQDLVDLSGAINTIFGDDSFKRYLVVFQNNHELRPTGGFMGSFAIVDVQKGKILNIEIPSGGTYDLQGQLSKYVKPPLPFQLLNKRWEFQDANWFPDFPATAQKISWFYKNGRNTTVDGVIAVNATVLERMLKVLGPVEAKQLLLDKSNALEQLQYEIEVGYDKKTEKPKEILTEVLSQMMSSLSELKTADVMSLLTELHEALQQKEIQVYMDDEKVENQLSLFGWTGEIINTQNNQDYLSIFHTNIQGQKSDARISQSINHEAIIDEDGNIIDTVIIERKHNGDPGEQFYGGLNISYVRVYVPEGSELISAGGFSYPPEDAFRVPEKWYEDDVQLKEIEKEGGVHLETGTRITHEFGKTAFGNWVMTNPGQTSTVYFRYKLPFKAQFSQLPTENVAKWQNMFVPALNRQTSRYSLYVQKQSGIDSNFSSTVIYPSAWLPVWKSNSDIDLALNGAKYETVLKTDQIVGIVLEKEMKE